MDANHQLIVRLKAFLSSSELIDSPTAQELYNAYRELNNSAVARLVQCEFLLQKKQKIEAVVLAQQDPKLFDLIDSLLFPERKDLLILADLYDWTLPDEINTSSMEKLRSAVSEMDDLRPLLTEFRRIARTDQVANKLHLLREICRIDKDNPEWRTPLVEVENQYVSQLISEAQQVIQNKNFVRLEQINDELENSHWVVTIPTIVLEKVKKVVTAHRAEEAKNGAIAILERINAAFQAFDIGSLEDALVCWEEHCRKYNYTPDSKEDEQLKEATNYLTATQKKMQEEKDFQTLLEHISALMDEDASLAQVESFFAKANATGMEIPAYLARRVEKYRIDIERAERSATIIRSLKIVGAVAVILLIVVGSAWWGIDEWRANSKSKDIAIFLNEGKLEEAQSLIEDFEVNHPRLAKHQKIAKAKAKLQGFKDEENKREAEFNRLANEIAELQKQCPYSPLLEEKWSRLDQLAKSELEKDRARTIRSEIDTALAEHKNKIQNIFFEKIGLLKKYNDEIISLIRENDFEQAEKLLGKLIAARQEITDLGDMDLTLTDGDKALLESPATLQDMLKKQKAVFQEIEAIRKSMQNSSNLAMLESALALLVEKLDKKINESEVKSAQNTLSEIAYFKAISNYQSNSGSGIPSEYAESAFFADAQAENEFSQACAGAKTELVSTFDSLQKNTNRRRLIYIQISSGVSLIDIYAFADSFTSQNNSISMIRNSGEKVEIIKKGYQGYYNVKIGNTIHNSCKLVYPEDLSFKTLKKSTAFHQKFINRVFSQLKSVDDRAIFQTGLQWLEEIRQDEPNKQHCAPYWKMKLSLCILEAICKLDQSSAKSLAQYQQELQKLLELDDEEGNPMDNQFLTEKIELFYKQYDFSALEKCLEQNKVLLDFRNGLAACSIQYLGYATMDNNTLKYTIASNLKDVSTDVYCFDKKLSGIQKIGHYDKNGLMIDRQFQKDFVGHLLFTFEPAGCLNTLFKGLKDSNCGIQLSDVKWPEFWPQNMRGEN